MCSVKIVAMELGDVLRDRRKAAGRTIASVAVDAGLSVPYIANLENGRGNPTVAALDRLATALGARLEVRISEEEPVGSAAASASVAAELLAGSSRAEQIITALTPVGRSRTTTRRHLAATLDALTDLLGHPPTPADLNRLLDLLQLADG
jgi:transcriptional regulator with XRE-family HTH domain